MTRIRVTLLCVAVFAVGAECAHAQTGGLFGATRSDVADRNRLNVTFSASEGYDSDVPQEVFIGTGQGNQSGGRSTLLSTSAEYANVGRRLGVAASVQSSIRYYEHTRNAALVSHSGTVGGNVTFSRTTALRVDQTILYSPSYLYQLFPGTTPPDLGEVVVAPPELILQENGSYQYRTSAQFTAGSERGHQVLVHSNYERTDGQNSGPDLRDLTTFDLGGTYSRGLGRHGSVFGGYELRSGEYSTGTTTEHILNVGGAYTFVLSSRRRLGFRGQLGPSFVDLPQYDLPGLASGGAFHLQGDGTINYQFGRSWSLGASYRRGVDYNAVVIEPIFTDSASINLSGLITRRIDVNTSVGLADGKTLVTEGLRHIETYMAQARVRVALTRWLAAFGEYVYYSHDVGGEVAIPGALTHQYEQQGFRVGATVWAPVF